MKVGVALIAGMLGGGCALEPEPEPVSYVSTYKQCTRTDPSYRDNFPSRFELKLGAGWQPLEASVFKSAAKKWREETGIQLVVTEGHALAGSVHLYDKLYVCGEGVERADQRDWENYMGCWLPGQDRIALSRPGIREFSETLAHDFGSDAPPPEKLYQQALYFTALHEIGHWLGLGHAPDGEKSIMVGSPLQAFLGEGKYNRLWMVDKRLACLKNDCGDNWCSKIKQ